VIKENANLLPSKCTTQQTDNMRLLKQLQNGHNHIELSGLFYLAQFLLLPQETSWVTIYLQDDEKMIMNE